MINSLINLFNKPAKKAIKIDTTDVNSVPYKLPFPQENTNENFVRVYDRYGEPKLLGELIARGGEGSIYPLLDKSNIVVKLYHTEKLISNRIQLQKKIESMISKKDELAGLNICWPSLSIYNHKREWVGYAMKRAVGVPMRKLAHAVVYKKYFPSLDRIIVVKYILSFLKTINILHSKNVYIGDYNLMNFLCDPLSHTITFIDSDSYQVTIGNTRYNCPVGTPDLTPIEHHNLPFDQIVRNERSEVYSVAIIIFECMMLGRHPFDIVGGDDPVTNLRNSNFPYGLNSKGLPPGPWYNIWSHMSFRMKQLFIQVFMEGGTDKFRRPSVDEWIDILQIYLIELEKGWHNKDIIPQNPKSKEYRKSPDKKYSSGKDLKEW